MFAILHCVGCECPNIIASMQLRAHQRYRSQTRSPPQLGNVLITCFVLQCSQWCSLTPSSCRYFPDNLSTALDLIYNIPGVLVWGRIVSICDYCAWIMDRASVLSKQLAQTIYLYDCRQTIDIMRSTLWLSSLDLEALWSDYGGGKGDLEVI